VLEGGEEAKNLSCGGNMSMSEGSWELKKQVWLLMLWANVVKGGGEGGANSEHHHQYQSLKTSCGALEELLLTMNFLSFVI